MWNLRLVIHTLYVNWQGGSPVNLSAEYDSPDPACLTLLRMMRYDGWLADYCLAWYTPVTWQSFGSIASQPQICDAINSKLTILAEFWIYRTTAPSLWCDKYETNWTIMYQTMDDGDNLMKRRVMLTRPRDTHPTTLASQWTCEPCHDYMATTQS